MAPCLSHYEVETFLSLGWSSALVNLPHVHLTMKCYTLQAGRQLVLGAALMNPGTSILPTSLMQPIFFLAFPLLHDKRTVRKHS